MAKEKQLDITNIKKAATGGYQIQFIVKGKSHSGFAKALPEAIKIRDKLKKKLKILPTKSFRNYIPKNKTSLIPGTKRQMPAGITETTFQSRGYESYYILVNWKDSTGKNKTKSFYCGRETTTSLQKKKEAYKRALEFRQAYEKAVLDETLNDFDPDVFNVSKKASFVRYCKKRQKTLKNRRGGIRKR